MYIHLYVYIHICTRHAHIYVYSRPHVCFFDMLHDAASQHLRISTGEASLQEFLGSQLCQITTVISYSQPSGELIIMSIHVHIYKYIRICIHTYICIHIYIYIDLYVLILICVYTHVYTYVYAYINICTHNAHTYVYTHQYMGWLRLVGPLKLYVSFAKEHYKRDYILQNRPVI